LFIAGPIAATRNQSFVPLRENVVQQNPRADNAPPVIRAPQEKSCWQRHAGNEALTSGG
jgi:hypothetical protein